MSEANFVDNTCGCSSRTTFDSENRPSTSSSSVEEVNLEENIIPRKRSKSPEDVNFSYKGKGKYSQNSKRKRGNISKSELCQTPHTSSAFPQSSSQESSSQRLELLVPNNYMMPSTSRTNMNWDNSSNSHKSNEKSTVKSSCRKRRFWRKKKPSSETITANTQVTQKEKQENFEDELTCSICSEIFINAVTLNCSHSFCKYCIVQWRKYNDTCPICRTIISSQNSTLVLDKCVERVLQTSSEKMKEYRKKIIAYRERCLDEILHINSLNNNGVNNNNGATDNNGAPNNNGTTNNNGVPNDFYPSSDDDDDDFQVNIYTDNPDLYDDDFINDYDWSDDAYYAQLSNSYIDESDDESQVENNVDSPNVDDENRESYSEEDENLEADYEFYEGEDEFDIGSDCADEEGYESELEYVESSYEESDVDEDIVPTHFGRKCFNCGISGHIARYCPTRAVYTGKIGAYYGGYGSCFLCNMEGHWANGCPN